LKDSSACVRAVHGSSQGSPSLRWVDPRRLACTALHIVQPQRHAAGPGSLALAPLPCLAQRTGSIRKATPNCRFGASRICVQEPSTRSYTGSSAATSGITRRPGFTRKA